MKRVLFMLCVFSLDFQENGQAMKKKHFNEKWL